MSGKFYAVELSDDISDDELEQINAYADEGTPVIIVGDLLDLEELDIDPDSVELVEIDN